MEFADEFEVPSSCREVFVEGEAGWAALWRERGILLAGRSEVEPPYRITRRAAKWHLVAYTFGGEGVLQWRHNDELGQERLGAGQLWLAPSGQPHCYAALSTTWRLVWFHLRDEPRWKELGSSATPRVRVWDGEEMVACMNGLVRERASAERDSLVAACCYAELLAVQLERALSLDAAPEAALRASLARLWSEVEANLAHPWTVEAMAARLPVSPSYFYRLVAQHHGITPAAMVSRLRLRRAEFLLRSTPLSLERIAALVGYSSGFALSKAWKRQHGHSPGTVRRS